MATMAISLDVSTQYTNVMDARQTLHGGCCSVLTGVSGTLQRRLQSVFSAAAWLVFSARKSEHVTPLLQELHWLKVPERIQFRLCVLVHRCLHGNAPPWHRTLLRHYTSDVESRRCLRSGSTSTLLVLSTRRATLDDRDFLVAASRAWNALPSSVRTSSTYLAYRRQLKTLLFKAFFEDRTWLRYLFVAQR